MITLEGLHSGVSGILGHIGDSNRLIRFQFDFIWKVERSSVVSKEDL